MKLLAYTTFTKQKKLIDTNPREVKQLIPQLMLEGYNRILAKWQNDLFILEQIQDESITQGLRITDPSGIKYTKTIVNYHPYQDQLS